MRKINPSMVTGLIAGLGFAIFASHAAAQTSSVSAQEYIQSTSPIAGGGHVTSISKPGQGVQTITSIASLPAVSPQQPAVATGFTPRSNAPFGTGVIQQQAAGNTMATGTNTRYAYPASSAPTTYAPTAGSIPAATTGAPNYNNNSRFSAQDYQNQAFGATMSTRQVADTAYRQNAPILATPTGQFNYPYGVAPATTNQTAAANAATPNLNIQMPGQPAPAFQAPPQGTPPGMVPPMSGTQAVNYQNMPPGAYAGRNISGKTKSYVDGQPLRNLFRYIFP